MDIYHAEKSGKIVLSYIMETRCADVKHTDRFKLFAMGNNLVTPLTLAESARFVGKISYVELQLCSVLAKKSTLIDQEYQQIFLSSASAAHAWRSQQLFDLLPVSVGLESRDELIESFNPEFDRLLVHLGEEESAAGLLTALLRKIYPTLLLVYEERLQLCCSPADMAAKRVFQRVKADLEEVIYDGNLILEVSDGATSTEIVDERIVTLLRQLLPSAR